MRAPRPLPSPILFIADAGAPEPLDVQVREAVAGGAAFIEIRGRRSEGGSPESRARLDEVERCLAVAGNASVIINDRVDLAILADAAGAHVGQADLPALAARRLLGRDRFLGISTHDEAQFAAALQLPVDYVALGPIFLSATKAGHAAPLGLERLAACVETSRLPVVAIGGIDVARLPAVLDAGASCVAMASAISRGPIELRMREVLALAHAHEPVQRLPEGRAHVILAGSPGAGKSSVGPLLARRLGLPFTDLDAVVAPNEGAGGLLRRVGEEAFRDLEARTLRALLAAPRQVIALGGGSVLGEWTRILLAQAGVRPIVLRLSPSAAAQRLTGATDRPLLEAARSAGGGALEAHFLARLEVALCLPRALAVDAEGSPEAVAERVIQALAP